MNNAVTSWKYKKYAGPEILTQEKSPAKSLAPGEIRVELKALSVNPIDWKLMSGALRFLVRQKLPTVPCFDIAGIVQDANEVEGFKNGDRVFARLNTLSGGAASDNVAMDASVASHLPDSISFDDGAALPLAGLTALQGLRDKGGMPVANSTKRVLIVGASGGVGHYAVQIAKNAGSHVTAICGTNNVQLVTSLGADEVIDYKKRDDIVASSKKPYDIILDCVGYNGSDFSGHFRSALADDGVYVSPIPTKSSGLEKLKFWAKQPVKFYFMKPVRKDLDLLADLFVNGKLKSVIDSTFGFSDLPKALERSMSGRAVGKIVVTV